MPIDKTGKRIDQATVDRFLALRPEIDLQHTILNKESAVAFMPASHVDDTLGRISCTPVLIWTLAGRASTYGKAEQLIHLNALLCMKHDKASTDRSHSPFITNEPWFVATPLSNKPYVLTTSYEMVESQFPWGHVVIDPSQPSLTNRTRPTVYDITVKVMSWGLDGNPAPNVDFSWHCVVEGIRGMPVEA